MMRRITLLAIVISFFSLPCCNRTQNSGIKEAGLENGARLNSDSEGESLENIKPEFRSLIGSFRNLLEKKRKDPSFCAQYQLSLSLRPRIAAGTRKNIFIQSKRSYYADEKAENFQSTILIQDGHFFWKYSDTSYGAYYFRGPLDIGTQSGEEYLQSAGFVHNTYGDLDDDLVSLLEEILEKSDATTPSPRENGKITIVSNAEYGKLELIPTSSEFSVTRLAAGQETNKTVLSYNYSNKGPEKSQDPRPAFLAEFAKPSPDVKINLLKGQITWTAIFDEYFAELTQVRDVAIREAMETARKFGYLYPTKTPEIVKSAQTYYGQLSLTIEIKGKKYMFHQFPPGNIDFSPLDLFTKRKRTAKGFEVLEVIDPGNVRRVYYVKREKKQMLIFDDPAGFQDEKLDSLVDSFTVISARK